MTLRGKPSSTIKAIDQRICSSTYTNKYGRKIRIILERNEWTVCVKRNINGSYKKIHIHFMHNKNTNLKIKTTWSAIFSCQFVKYERSLIAYWIEKGMKK